ncbi:hypothetical protein GCM10009841_01310 [Microlunatus panaciterrae]|uniref:Uncharacterized protein n=1 Tax=Microlunatus panaciterrae TaxID=400768 RepID=A0ABS2RJM5_9ACTN|nr:hypothetical protein [Microlunatus panaciterrae]MBM7799213.1 hypothetical protein [Microlunatus panaciterrae]
MNGTPMGTMTQWIRTEAELRDCPNESYDTRSILAPQFRRNKEQRSMVRPGRLRPALATEGGKGI